MKRTALLLGACLLLSAAARAADPPELLPPPKGAEAAPAGAAPAAPAAEPVAGVAIDGAAEPCPAAGKWTQKRHDCMHSMGDCARSVWDWLTWRPHVCHTCCCCCKQCAGCCPPVYTFFFCQCGYPEAHIPWHAYIGQDLPPRDHCPYAQGCGGCCGH